MYVCMREGEILVDWKTGVIVPIWKRKAMFNIWGSREALPSKVISWS